MIHGDLMHARVDEHFRQVNSRDIHVVFRVEFTDYTASDYQLVLIGYICPYDLEVVGRVLEVISIVLVVDPIVQVDVMIKLLAFMVSY